jgi:enoyl-[acyl-carrier protein] reductase I
MTDSSGTHGVIVGVANKRSLAWAIAQAMDAAGAQLTLSYATERFEDNVRKLGATLRQPPLIVPCDVTSDEQVRNLFSTIERERGGGLDFLVHAVAFASREALSEPFIETSREAFLQAHDVSAYSLVALAREAAPLMEQRGGGSILTLTYLGSQRVFPHYNVMGVAKAALEAVVRYLAGDLGSRNIRVNAVSAGPIKTLSAAGISGFSQILQHYRDRSPLGRTVDVEEVAEMARFLLGPGGRGVTGEVVMVDGGFHTTGM